MTARDRWLSNVKAADSTDRWLSNRIGDQKVAETPMADATAPDRWLGNRKSGDTVAEAPTAPDPSPPDPSPPDGTRLRLAHGVRRLDGGRTLVGGMPATLLHLRPAARHALDAGGRSGELVVGPTTRALAALLLDRGLVDPVVDAHDGESWLEETTVVVPVKDRTDGLRRLLATLPVTVSVVVVDDGSRDAASVAAVVHARGATLVRHDASRGPAAARNAGLARVTTRFVAFVDSDVDASGPWLPTLLAHLHDPAVHLVAPRVLGVDAGPASVVARYEAARSSLDLGPHPALVRPRGWVSYVPSACLVARTDALAGGFDERLEVAEDVDLVWRVVAAGGRVRYEPAATVRHDHRVDLREWLDRKHFYGTGAGLLAERHGDLVAPVVVAPWSAAVVALLLVQRRWSIGVAGIVATWAARRLTSRLGGCDHPARTAVAMTALGTQAAAGQAARAITRHWWPLAVAACLVSRRARRAAVVAALAEGLADHARIGPDLDPVRYVVAHRLDDLAYGAGLWRGALGSGRLRALLPALHRS